MRLKDKIILVTASTRGIGLAIARQCAAEGATVYMAARDPRRAETEAAALREQGWDVRAVYHDATKPETYTSMVQRTVAESGRLDVLVNNFGISDRTRDLDFRHTDPDTFLDTVTTNLRSVYLASHAAVHHMHRGGSIINISSVGGIVPDMTQVGYGTGKAAINHLTKLIAVQEASRGIRCNAVLPGMTATDAVNQNLTPQFRDVFQKHIPLRRMGTPEEIAMAVVYLASDESAYITGQLLTVAGGFGLPTPLYGDFSNHANTDLVN